MAINPPMTPIVMVVVETDSRISGLGIVVVKFLTFGLVCVISDGSVVVASNGIVVQ